MRREACGSVRYGIKDLEDQSLVPGHFREIEPVMFGAVADHIGLTHATRRYSLGDEQLIGFEGAGIAYAKRVGLNRFVNGAPELDDREAVF